MKSNKTTDKRKGAPKAQLKAATTKSRKSSANREVKIIATIRKAVVKAGGPKRKSSSARPSGRIELLRTLRTSGGAWVPDLPAHERTFRGLSTAPSTNPASDAAYVPVIAGIILDKEGRRVAERVVRLCHPEGAVHVITRTDQEGHFRFPSVKPGEYTLRSGQMLRKIVVVDPRTSVIQ